MSIRVLIVDDQVLVRRGFAMIIDHQDDMEVVGEAGTGIEAIARARDSRADVVLMDIRMPEMDGLEATRRILAEGGDAIRVIVLTTFDPDEYIYRALQLGASAFVLKDIPPEELVAAVRTVAGGGALLAPSITRRLITRFAEQTTADPALQQRLERLTGREREVLEALGRGMNNQEIAAFLNIGAATVKTHVSNVLSKLGLRDRAQAVVFTYESGLNRGGQLPGH